MAPSLAALSPSRTSEQKSNLGIQPESAYIIMRQSATVSPFPESSTLAVPPAFSPPLGTEICAVSS